MKTIKQLKEVLETDKQSPFDKDTLDPTRPSNGVRQGKTVIAKNEPGLKENTRYFVKKTGAGLAGARPEAHGAALASRVFEHFGVGTNNQRVAHVRLEGDKHEQHALLSEWHEDFKPPIHPAPQPSKQTGIHGTRTGEMPHHQRVQYAKADILGTAMGMGDLFNIYGSRGSNIKEDEHGNLRMVDMDEGFRQTGSHYDNAVHYAKNPGEIHLSAANRNAPDDFGRPVADRVLIRNHLMTHHPEAYHQATQEISNRLRDPEAHDALREHFNTHAAAMQSDRYYPEPKGEHVHKVFNMRLGLALTGLGNLALKPNDKKLREHWGVDAATVKEASERKR